MEKFIEEAIKKANDANLMSDEAHEHISKLFDRDKIKVLEEWRKAQPEEIVMLFCALFNPILCRLPFFLTLSTFGTYFTPQVIMRVTKRPLKK